MSALKNMAAGAAFQFHKGTIKTIELFTTLLSHVVISIP